MGLIAVSFTSSRINEVPSPDQLSFLEIEWNRIIFAQWANIFSESSFGTTSVLRCDDPKILVLVSRSSMVPIPSAIKPCLLHQP